MRLTFSRLSCTLLLPLTLAGCSEEDSPTDTSGAATGGSGFTTLTSTTTGTDTDDGSSTASGTASGTSGSSTATTSGSGTTDPTAGTTSSGTTDATAGSTTDATAGSTTDATAGSTTDATAGSTTDATAGSTTDPTGGTTSSGTTDPTAGSTTTGTTDPTGGTTGDPEPCATEQPTVTFKPPYLLFVLDKSGSMMSTFSTPQGTKTRWAALHDVITSVVTNYGDRINFGAKAYPTANVTGCPLFGGCPEQCNVNNNVEIQPGTGAAFLAALAGGALPARDATIGNYSLTPIQSGMQVAANLALNNYPGEDKALVLVADGEISTDCSGNSAGGVTGIISNLLTNGIPTYVVGINISQAQAVADMNNYAVAGGRPAPGGGFYDAENGAELDAAFEAIAEQVVSCTVTLSTQPPFPDLTEVEVNGNRYPYTPGLDCATQDGWVYVTDAMGAITGIELCGVACDGFKIALAADVEYFCTAG
jgi:hypothetical protein